MEVDNKLLSIIIIIIKIIIIEKLNWQNLEKVKN